VLDVAFQGNEGDKHQQATKRRTVLDGFEALAERRLDHHL
jgi:hypothetical protein